MGFIKTIINQHQKKVQERNEACNSLILRADGALNDAKAIFSIQQAFVEPGAGMVWRYKNGDVLADLEEGKIRKLKKAAKYKMLLAKQAEMAEVDNTIAQKISKHNAYVAKVKAQEAYALIGHVEGRKLDQQQMMCIVKEMRNHLVIAGAGTGKTTTVVGKVKYLLKTGKYLPQDILVLSFTNASATEMKERITTETGHNIAASTFHKLGLEIISRVEGKVPRITQINLRKFVKEQLLQNMQSDSYLRLLSAYLLYNRVVAKSEFEFKTKQEYDEYLKLNPPKTISNITVKSYGEMDIANFLTQNGVRYIYERPYEVDTRTEKYGQYHPDFYLPEYKIYIEYFGINRKGEVPAYFKAEDGKSATENYRASMEWKRQLHKAHQTTMIECYAYEKLEGNLLEALKERLVAASVRLAPKTAKEMWEQVAAEGDTVLDGMIELLETLINLIKSNGYDIQKVREMNRGGSNAQANNILLSLLEPIFVAYCKYLADHREIDFNDMINLASEYIRQRKYVHPYKYVIVDEYQDISKARFQLLESMRKISDYDLFCVGDDWQSIYRFAGSDIGFILNFAKYWGATEISRIETTYRFSQKMIEISGGFVMQNPAQIKKSIKGINGSTGFPLGEISGYTDKFAIEFTAKKLEDIPKGSSVFFIGRYSFDAKLLEDSELFSCQYNNVSGLVDVKAKNRPDLNMVFLTAHKSKGLQADYVFIINNKSSRMGFPSKIQDAPILELLLDNCDQFPYAEERRLFYVALTRAKKKAFVVTVDGQESVFAKELKNNYAEELKKERFTCPNCGGKLIKRSGAYGAFYGCANYPTCTYTRKLHER